MVWWKIILVVSAFVFVLIAIIVNVWIRLKIKKIKQKYINQDQEKTYLDLQKLRNDLGQLPFAAKEWIKNKYKPYDIEAVINTIYTNQFKSILIIDQSDWFLSATVSAKSKQKIYFLENQLNIEKLNELQKKFINDYSEINLQPYQDQNLDFLVVFKNEIPLVENFQRYYKNLTDNSMMMILIEDYSNKELKNFVKFLKTNNIIYEISYVESKFLYIAKKSN
ncbi:BC85_0335 family putative methyltransferase [Mycoplasmopsis cricetuli]|uniref:BC85_0335 family putative methyltransferase n=1 Tax=Mycoplasmopsis cricetuli TaxID=171283 RepID=UPI00046FF98A|nr:hypothetical protein [Mycoplasmopsis cricetuli]